jgi:hypothetical protein
MRWTFALVVCSSLAFLAPATAGAQTPVNLTAEVLTSPAVGAVAIDCQPSGTSTVSYTAEGAATGPYPGTFEETGSYTIVGDEVVSFEASFTIDSGLAEVVGTKTLRESLSAVCDPNPEVGIEDFTDVQLTADYEATITTPTGTLQDRGQSTIVAQLQTLTTGAVGGTLEEVFDSEDLVLTPGHITGAGLIEDAQHGHVIFGFTARSDGTSAHAKCAVIAEGTFVKCLNATLLMQTATHVTVVGEALVNGVTTPYRIDVDDLGEPGHGQDTFRIQASGFSAQGVLVAGNVQIHGSP